MSAREAERQPRWPVHALEQTAVTALPAHVRRRSWVRSAPDGACRRHHQAQFGGLLGLGQWIAGSRRGKPTLRGDAEPVEIDEVRRRIAAPLQILKALQL